MNAQKRRYDLVKRGVDIVAATTGLIFLSPIIGTVAVLVRMKLGSPVFFKQERPGRNGATFTLYKFRSMLNIDETKELVTNEQRLTTFGRWLRSTSLDELPSLLNVVKGDMSIVGPRPLRIDYLARYTPLQARRHEVRPGITGLAQVRGRNDLSWEQRFDLDVEYVDRYGPILDFQIIMDTLSPVFKREGIQGSGMGAMSAFVGAKIQDGLVESALDESWLATRVAWLQDPVIRQGITIDFTPDPESTLAWFNSVKNVAERKDWVYTDASGEAVAMAGINGVGTTTTSLYMYVHPDKHGRGYGSAVIRRLIFNARSFGAHTLSLEVKESNIYAIKMYERAGFRFHEKYLRDGVTKIRYNFNLKENF